jgi:hypothetical protein
MARARVLFVSIVACLLASTPAKSQQPWTQWLDQNHCAMTRSSWMAIAQSNPGFGWGYAPDAQDSATFMDAAAWLDVLRLSLAQGPGRNSPNFQNYCCQVDIWENTSTGQFSILPDGQIPGFGFQLSSLNKPVQCCEDAAFAIGSDPLGCTGVALMSVPGAVVTMTPAGPVSGVGTVSIPTNPPTVVAGGGGQQPKYPAGTFLGCYNDPNNPFDLDGYLVRSGQNTPQRCIQTCFDQGFAYAGVQYSQSCLCGNTYGKFGTADRCNMPCTGDASQICGGYNANSVYATGR